MGKACECGCLCIAIYFKLGIMISSIVIGCEYLLPVINYSKMEKPDNANEIDNLDIIESNVKEGYSCYILFSENKKIVSKFKMKQIKAFSIGLIIFLIIQLVIGVWFYGVLVISCCCISKDTLILCTLFYLISAVIIYFMHLLFFILFAVFYFKGKKAAKGIDGCEIASYYENCKTFFIVDLIFIFINFWLHCAGWANKGK